MLVVIHEYYLNNEDFKKYVDKYCFKHRIDILSAFKCEIIKDVYKYYVSENSQKIQAT